MQPASIDLRAPASLPVQQVHHLRQILLWPLRLVALRRGDEVQRRPWELLGADGGAGPWRRAMDEYSGTPDRFQERHYNEFVTFLPYVQQFLYGEGRGRHGDASPSSMHVFRRDDVRAVRLLPRPGDRRRSRSRWCTSTCTSSTTSTWCCSTSRWRPTT